MDRRRLGGFVTRALAAVVLLAASRAEGQPAKMPERVRVVLPECDPPPFALDSFLSLLRIELRTEGVAAVDVGAAASAPNGPPSAIVTISAPRCGPDATDVVATVQSSSSSGSESRTIALSDVPPSGRPRTLALAVAELLGESWGAIDRAEPAPTVEPQAAPAPAATAPLGPEQTLPARAARPVPEPRARTLLFTVVEARAFPAFGSGLLGPGLGAALPVGSHLRLRAEGSALFGSAYDPLGDISLGLASGALALTIGAGSETTRVELGPRVGLGYGWADGHPFDASVSGQLAGTYFLDASVLGAFAARLTAGLWLVAGLDVGAVAHGLDARANERRASGLGGPVLGVSLGVGYEL